MVGMTDESAQIGPAAVALFRIVHRRLRTLLDGASEDALGWRPALDTTPVSNLVLHLLGAEAGGFRVLVGVDGERDRDAEFSAAPLPAHQLVGRIDAADRELDRYAGLVSMADLTGIRPRPARNQAWPGLQVLLNNYGHVCEHAAQIALTLQLYERR